MKATSNTLSEIAPTLALLKKLPLALKSHVLLVRLAKIGQNESALNKHNLMMPGDPYGLAYGYSDAEKMPVREHLLGAPWTRLVNEGYLADILGQGFYRLTEEGKGKLDEAIPPTTSIPAASASNPSSGAPRAFLSYSWEGPEHQQWVTQFAERIHGRGGVEVTFDQWHLGPGSDKNHFMEQAVAGSDFVIVVCTPTYGKRANTRQGGVGYESMVITSEMAQHMLTNKFIPVLRRGNWGEALPIYLRSKTGVDLTGEPYSEDEYEKLLRALHKEPVQPPPLGMKPDFSNKPTNTPNATAQPNAIAVLSRPRENVSLLGPPDQRPNAIAWATYENVGSNAPRNAAYIRKWNTDGHERYSFETTRGEEFIGTKDEVIDRFISFHRALLKEGYKRMNFTPGPDPDFSVLGG